MSNRNIHINQGNYNEKVKGDYIQVDDKPVQYSESEVKQSIEITEDEDNVQGTTVKQDSRNINISGGILNVSGACAFNQGDITGTVTNNDSDEVEPDDYIFLCNKLEVVFRQYSDKTLFRQAIKCYKDLSHHDLELIIKYKNKLKVKYGKEIIKNIINLHAA